MAMGPCVLAWGGATGGVMRPRVLGRGPHRTRGGVEGLATGRGGKGLCDAVQAVEAWRGPSGLDPGGA